MRRSGQRGGVVRMSVRQFANGYLKGQRRLRLRTNARSTRNGDSRDFRPSKTGEAYNQKTCREHQHGPCGKSRRSRCERDRSGQEGNQVFGEGHRVHASARSGQEVHIQDRN